MVRMLQCSLHRCPNPSATFASDVPGYRGLWPHWHRLALSIAWAIAWTAATAVTMEAVAMENVTIDRDGAVVTVQGKVIAENRNGNMILQDRQGKLWPLNSEVIQSRTRDNVPFTLMDSTELEKTILEELPGFSIHKTKHFLICYNTSRAYAQWCGGLFERLFRAYNNFWKRRGLEVSEPEMPLVALIFKDKQSYRRYAAHELGPAVDSVNGYYNTITNRIAMHDLTAASRGSERSIQKPAEINELLLQPMAGQLVATVIHEATHQLSFNCNVQQRFSDIDVWLNEGLAMYFETPDLRSKKGWRGMGDINTERLARFSNYLKHRPADSLYSLIASGDRMQGRSEDQRFDHEEAILDAYSEAWALTYYLLTYEQKTFVEYLKFLGEKKPGITESSERKIEDFEKFFGDLEEVDRQFVKRMQKEIKRNAKKWSGQR
ncbi:MAG: DUF1570 domain-containing protein [Pirellulales bacterium]|nr:DUF1570 domain-containing protein [Pirellulales bacterium]